VGFFFENYSYYYYFVLGLQAICVIHCLRRGTQNKWIWLIVFLPLIGSIAYIFTEIIKKQHVSSVGSNIGNVLNPGGKIEKLEKNFRFTDTFTNRMALAEAYLENGMTQKAIDLYEPGLKGMFSDNELLIKQLILAYYRVERYEDIVRIAPRIVNTLDFSKSQANLLYALSLEKTGKNDLAEKEFRSMNHRYSNYEARYHYGKFLLAQNRYEDAAAVLHDIVDEAQHMNRGEKGSSKVWIDKAKQEWNKLMSAT
jgi:hypothetical protein